MNTLIAQKISSERCRCDSPRQEYEYLINFKKLKNFHLLWRKKSLVRAENNFKKKRLYPTMNSSKSWDLQIDSSVLKILQKIPRENAENILKVIKLLPVNPYFGDIQK